MSNTLAIATVTAALKETLQTAANQAVGNTKIHVGRPNDKLGQDNKPTVGLFLYRVMPSSATRNIFQPVRSGNGRLLATPYAALDLHYLVSFYGDESKFHPELMAAEVVRALESRPILTRSFLENTINKNNQIIGNSDLHKAAETVKATPVSLDLEELSKLWSIFFQVPYSLSLPYLCSYVVVEAEEKGGPTLPVTTPVVSVLPMTRVGIDSVEAEAGPSAPIVWGGKLRIRGHDLAKPGLKVRVGAQDVVLPATGVRPEEIVFSLAPVSFGGQELPAGVHGVQAVDPPPSGVPAHLERTTDLVAFALRPTVTVPNNPVNSAVDNGTASGKVTVQFNPKIVKGQTVQLLLEEKIGQDPKNYVLNHEHVPDPNYPASQLVFPYTKVKRTTYLVMAQVDGVYSAPVIETDQTKPDFGQIKGPEATVP